MKKKNVFLKYKKIFFLIFLFFLFVLSICTFLIQKKNIKINHEKIIEEFKNIVDLNEEKNLKITKKEILFFKKNKNIYGILVGMNLAKKYFVQHKYNNSIKILKKILSFNPEENLIYLTKLNLVKIYIKKKDFSLALKVIKHVKDDSWKIVFENYKNILLSKKRNIK
ncbi:tetratricopeptide repeat protein [Buchnera aphidicola]|uniref:Putative UPF0070 protein YfgM n=1 Tax=Buchnera aphidicola (Cinara strobi) TaxID=1921549 RepID=A0A3B1DX97_9GAMM|nr:tetratricopeptide repeat protein [Buchnera aphidicola]VAX76923.1 putative UPF0070 protein YfgM [Buchnera aphidicola (Cinara strobi)]